MAADLPPALGPREEDAGPLASGLGVQGFNGFVEDAAFALGKVVHKRLRAPISQVHVT
jgi:hypothetical protein